MLWPTLNKAEIMSKSLLYFTLAAFIEIAGCFAFWVWSRNSKYVLWLPIGVLGLTLFAWLLTRIDIDSAGRAYAAYGGIYITASIVWLMLVERIWPDSWDILGGGLSLLGAVIILVGHLGK
jgi:small multidrug resistance family-3 protein